MKNYLIPLSIIILLASCTSNKRDSSKVFRYNQGSGITSLDPAFARDQANEWAVSQLFNSLVQFDSSLHVQPCLAKSWDISDDGLTYTFHLRNDVYFQDDPLFPGGKGRLMNAGDVVYSFARLIDPKVASPGAWVFHGRVNIPADATPYPPKGENNAETAEVPSRGCRGNSGGEPFNAPDDTTFVLHLLKPFRPILNMLAMQYCSVVPKEVVEHYGRDFRTHPVGTGPFRFKIWEEDNALVLERNSRYFEKDGNQQLPYMDVVHISFIKSKQTEYFQFMKGDLDFMNGIDASTVNELLTKDGVLLDALKDKITLYKRPYLNTEYLGILMDDSKLAANSPLKKKAVRQAINYAINRADMVRYLRNNVGRPATAGFVPYGLPSFDTSKVKGYTYDPNEARRLLAEAGYPDGKNMPEIKLYTNATYEDMGNYIYKQLHEVGINVVLETVPPAFQRELMAKSQADFFRGSWIADYADAENYLSLFYGPNASPPNYTRFHNTHYDSLYVAALNENDDAKRYALYQQMNQMIIDEAPVVPLYYDEVLRFVSKNVSGLEPDPMNSLDLKRVRK